MTPSTEGGREGGREGGVGDDVARGKRFPAIAN